MQHNQIMKMFILYKPMWPPEQAQFWPQGHNLDRLGSGPLGDATYKI